jgi:ketosteroid isomerase-like protein
MGSPSDNVAKLKHAYRQWHESKGATPKADFWTFRNGKAVEFHEFYDTAALIAAAKP